MKRLQQIDIFKGLAAVSVVILHSVSRETLLNTWSILSIWQAVPIFILLMGMTSRFSFERHRRESLSALARGIPNRLRRLLLPFVFAWIASLLLGLHEHAALRFGRVLLMELPGPGMGSYFVALAVSFVLLAPPLYRMFCRWPKLTLAASFALDLAFELAAPRVSFLADGWIYAISPLRYLPLFVLGFWLAEDTRDAALRTRLRRVLPWAAASLAYLALWNLGRISVPSPAAGWAGQSFPSFGYTLALCILGLRFLPSDPASAVARLLARLGVASYHIFMTQMFVTAVAPSTELWRIIVNVVACCFIGLGWFEAESRITRRRRPRGRILGLDTSALVAVAPESQVCVAKPKEW